MKLTINGRFLTQPVTGVQRYARELCATLDEALPELEAESGLTVELLTPPLEPALAVDLPTYEHIRVREVGRGGGHRWEQTVLPRHLGDTDVLFCPGNTAPLLTLRRRSPAVVVTVHDLAFRDFPETVSSTFRRVYEVLVPSTMRRAERVITVSEAERTRMLAHFPMAADRLVAVANGGLPRHRPKPTPDDPTPPKGPFVLYVGALNPRKNVAGVIAAARALLADRPDLRAVFVGDPSGIYQAVDLGPADDRMVFAGKLSDAALEAHYDAASVLLFPSFHEASGLPPVEAMAHGCPVVVSEIPALRERCGDAALYCDPHDVATMVAQVSRILDEPDLAADLATRGRERAGQFTWANCLTSTLEVVDAAAGGRAAQ
ncbi:glycosyltransferase family 1 protein [Nocardioides sp.]|uniref:glycosyltransferase family 4 protein n=1 Tax=Nocardioides sp. TaxID=35761 RepID=UPI002B271048|nr:glycosyltransferase family 1 protein [Nocardioides sp.]